MRQLLLDLLPAPEPTLEHFVPGRNGELLAALARFASTGGERTLYLWGGPGSGRTHLLHAAVRAAGAAASYQRAPELGAELPAAGLVAVDDLHLAGAAGQSVLFRHLVDLRDPAVTRLLCAGDAPPGALDLRADLATRLAAGLVFQLHPLTDAQKAEALRARAHERGFSLAPDAAELMLALSPRDLGSLFGVLETVDRHALAQGRPVTTRLVRELLRRPEGGSHGP